MCNCVSSNEGGDGTPLVPLIAPAWAERDRPIGIDACIAHVIVHLWARHIVTRGCCCGHNQAAPSLVLEEGASEDTAMKVRQLIAEVDDRRWTLYAWRLTEVARLTQPGAASPERT